MVRHKKYRLKVHEQKRKRLWNKNHISVNVGILPYIYSGFKLALKYHIGDDAYSQLPPHLKHDKSDSREKAYVLYVLLSRSFYNKTIHNYNSKDTRNKLCSSFNISPRSYQRYIGYLIENGFAFVDAQNPTVLRLKSINKIVKSINEEYEKYFKSVGIKPIYLLRATTATVEIPNPNFKYVQSLIRYTYIKYDEVIKKTKILKNITKSKKRKFSVKKNMIIKNDNLFASLENNFVDGELVCPYRAKTFNDLYTYVYKKTRAEEASDLRNLYILEKTNKKVVVGSTNKNQHIRHEFSSTQDLINERYAVGLEPIKVVATRLANKREVIRTFSKKNKSVGIRQQLAKYGEYGVYDDEIIDEISSRPSFGFIEKDIQNNITKHNGVVVNGGRTRISRSINPINRVENMKDLSEESYYTTLDEVEYNNSASILSPYQYFKLLNCDFDLSYRSGLTRIGNILGLSKSQTSRTIKKMEDYGLTKITSRYVYISSVNTNDPTSLIKAMSQQYTIIYGSGINQEQIGFNRLVFRHGSILYQIESNKENLINIKFKIADDKLGSDKLIHMKKYEKLCKRLYGNDIDISPTKHHKVFNKNYNYDKRTN